MVSVTSMARVGHPKFISAAGLAFTIAGCNGDCVVTPCALPIAVVVDITSASSGAAVSGASIAVSGAVISTVPCDGSCKIMGYAGTYTLDVSAPGYQSTERTVLVRGSSPACGCASTEPERVSIALTPTP
jgi:hypothetical protein